LGGVTTIDAGLASNTFPSISMDARIIPSQVSSCHPSLFAKVVGGILSLDSASPFPGTKITLPSLSVSTRPRFTLFP